MSALPAVPVLLLLAALVGAGTPAGRATRARPRRARPLGARPWRRAVGAWRWSRVAVVWAAYLAVDPRLRWTRAGGVPAVDGLRGLVVDLLPFPEPYRDGMRIQFGFEDRHVAAASCSAGVYRGSLWYYLPAALLVKTPLGMLALWAAGAAAMLAVPRLRPAAPYVLVPAGRAAGRGHDRRPRLRHPVRASSCRCSWRWRRPGVLAVRWRWAPAVTAALVLFVAVSSLRTFPYYLPYSNEAFGGPSKTHLRLHDSNVDWGQDLGRLADRLRERYPGERIWLVYKGSGVPSVLRHPRVRPAHGAARAGCAGCWWCRTPRIAKADRRLAALIDDQPSRSTRSATRSRSSAARSPPTGRGPRPTSFPGGSAGPGGAAVSVGDDPLGHLPVGVRVVRAARWPARPRSGCTCRTRRR